MDVVLTFCSIRLSLRLIFFSPDEVMSGRGRVNPEDRVEYEYEFVDGKRKAPRVVILGGGSPAGGPSAGGPPQTQRHNSRGALLASSFSTKQTVACRLFTRVAFFFPVSAGFFYSLHALLLDDGPRHTPHASIPTLSRFPRYRATTFRSCVQPAIFSDAAGWSDGSGSSCGAHPFHCLPHSALVYVLPPSFPGALARSLTF